MSNNKKSRTQGALLILSALTAAQLGIAYAAQGPGTASAGAWQLQGTNWIYRDASGAQVNGWVKTASGWYYLDQNTGIMQTGWFGLDGKQYYLNTKEDGLAGQMRTGWYMSPDGKWYFFSTAEDASEGMMLTGWQWIDGYCYYFEPENGTSKGVMYAAAKTPDGKTVNADGRLMDDAGNVQYTAGKGYLTVRTQKLVVGTGGAGGGGSSSGGGGGGSSSSGGSNSGNNGSNTGGNPDSGSDNTEKPDNGDGETKPDKPDTGDGETKPDKPDTGDGETKPDKPDNGDGETKPDKPDTGDGETKPDKPDTGETEQASLFDESLSKITEVNSLGTWLPIVFEAGYNASNTRVEIDGEDVTDALRNVTDDGSIAKLALQKSPEKLTVSSIAEPKKTESIILNQSAARIHAGEETETDKEIKAKNSLAANEKQAETISAVYQGNDYLPEKILTHGAVSVWDYHLTNYDDEGNVRVSPKKTTFNLGETKEEHPAYSPETILPKDGSAATVEILFNYNTEAEKEWFDSINKQELVSYDERKDSLNSNLTFDKEKNVTHGSGKAGVLKIKTGQSNFYSNMRYYVRVRSKAGSTALVPIELVQEKQPSLKLQETPQSGLNLHFEVADMTYGINNPIERVTLKDPAGTVHELTYIDDYFLFGDLFVLYNDVEAENGTNHLRYKGTYELSIEANGFQTFGKKFQVANGEAAPAKEKKQASKLRAMDAVSMATSGGGSTGDGGSGSVMTSANLIFDTDLLVNARLLEAIGKANDAANAVIDRWYSVICDAAFDEGDEDYFDWTDYINRVEDTKLEEGRMLPFAEYRESGVLNPNHPASAKEVLEDGLLGEVQTNGNFSRLDAPELHTVQNEEGKDVILQSENTAYISKVNAVYINENWQAIDQSKYTVDAEKGEVIFDKSLFTPGEEYRLSLEAAGYKTNFFKLIYDKKLETELILSAIYPEGKDAFQAVRDEKAGKDYAEAAFQVNGSAGDFLSDLSEVRLDDDLVYTKGVEGSDAVYYTVLDGKLQLKLNNVQPGQHELELRAAHYTDALRVTFDVLEADEEQVQRETPQAKKFVKIESNWGFDPELYRLSFSGLDAESLTAYLNQIQSITVGGVTYEKKTLIGTETENAWRIYASDSTGAMNAYDVIDFTVKGTGFSDTEDTEVVMEAEGYEPLAFTVNKDKELGQGESSLKPAPALNGSHKAEEGEDIILEGDEAYLRAIRLISKEEDGSSIRFELADGKLHISSEGILAGESAELLIQAEGYENQRITVSVKEAAAEESKVKVKSFRKAAGILDTGYEVRFNGLEGEALTAYLNSITYVSVGGTEYTKALMPTLMSSQEYALKASDTTQSIDGYDILKLGESAFSDTEDTEVVIEADGYDAVRFVVDKNKKLKQENKQTVQKTENLQEENAEKRPEKLPTEATQPETNATDEKLQENGSASEEVSSKEQTSSEGDETQKESIASDANAEEAASQEKDAAEIEAETEADTETKTEADTETAERDEKRSDEVMDDETASDKID